MTKMLTETKTAAPRILGVGTANPETVYSQEDILNRYQIQDERIRSLFLKSHIDRRHLLLPEVDGGGYPTAEVQGQLLSKHRTAGIRLAGEALAACLKNADLDLDEVR